MNKYINANELIDEIIFNEEDVGIIGSKEAIDIIQNMPSADVVEVVRCKDCIYHHKGHCPMYVDYQDWADDDDFCSWGERKDKE